MKPFYERGGITIWCGDCLEIMPRLCVKFDAVITDPPYGINYQSARRTDKASRFDIILNDNAPQIAWMVLTARSARCLFTFCRWDVSEQFREAIVSSGWNMKSQVIWDRVTHGLGDLKSQYAPQHDNAWFAIQNGYTFPSKRPTSVYRFARVPAEKLLHPTQKPEPLMKKIVLDLTKRKGTIIDPFMGSGTTLVAAQNEGRRAVGIELSEKYCKIAVERLRQPSFWSIPDSPSQPRQVNMLELLEQESQP